MTSLVKVVLSAAALSAPPVAGGLGVEWLYNAVDRPIMINVVAPPDAGALTLVLMDHDGNLQADPIEVQPGRMDLTRHLPNIKRLRRAGYLQLFVGEEPIGASLVLQPMMSRMVPITEDAVNPNGIRYTRIVGWQDETQPAFAPDAKPSSPETPKAPSSSKTPPPKPPDASVPAAPYDPWLANQPSDERLFSGLRVYPERDVRLHTTHGDIVIALRPDQAPNSVWNFLQLCEGGFYRDIPFHRIVPMTRDGDPFVIQAGDPTSSGSGGPGYWLPMERSELPHDFGVISMARDVDPDSAGSQIFLCLSRKATARLDGHYCAFGQTVDGADTILSIAEVELADVASGRPVTAPLIRAAELVPAPPRRPGEGRADRPVRRAAPRAPTAPERVPR